MKIPVLAAIALLCAAPVQAQSPTAEEWRADIAALDSGIRAMHPAPFHTVSEDDFAAAIARLSAEAGERSEAEMIAGLVEIVAMLGEGHSRIVIPIAGSGSVGAGHTADHAPRISPLARLPVQLMLADQDYVVVRTSGDHVDLLGARLEAVDGMPIAAVAGQIAPLVNADSPAELRTRIGDFLMVPALLRARGLETGTHWRLVTPAGETREVEFSPVTASVDWIGGEPYPSPPDDAPSPVNWVQELGGGRVLLRLGEIGDQDAMTMTGLADAAARLLAGQNDPSLIVDLRGNPGGDNSQIDSIVRLAVRDERLWRPGHLFVLIDGRTHSAAMNLANGLDKWTPAIFVGSPTAASPNSYGDARPLELPHSGLSARISTLYWQDGGPMDSRLSISPEIAAPYTQASIAAGRDPALETVAAIADAPAGAPGTFRGTAAISGRDLPMTAILSGDRPTIEVAGLTREPLPLEGLQIGPDGSVTASMTAAGTTIRVTARIAGDWLVGHVSVRGRVYALALQRIDPVPAE